MESQYVIVPFVPSEKANKSEATRKRKMSEREVTQPQKRKPAILKLRTTPKGIYNLVRELSDVQKEAVKAIGFGSLLLLGISKCPFELSRHLLRKFDSRKSSLILSNGETFRIDEEDIQCVLNLPRGDIQITESIGLHSDDGPEYLQMLRDWRRRWVGSESRGAPTTVSMPSRILANTEANDDFKRDFVVFVVSSFLWTTQNKQCRFKILKSLMDVERIKDLNWCKFTLDGLIDSVSKWQANEASYFHGPLTFLLLCYMDRVKDYRVRQNYKREFPILSCWDDKMISERIKNEQRLGGYGLGTVVDRIPLPGNRINVEVFEPRPRPVVTEDSSVGVAALKKMADAALQLSRASQLMADATQDLMKCTSLYKAPSQFSYIEVGMQPVIEAMVHNETVRKMFEYGLRKATDPPPHHEAHHSPKHEAHHSPQHEAHHSPQHEAHESPEHEAHHSPQHEAHHSLPIEHNEVTATDNQIMPIATEENINVEMLEPKVRKNFQTSSSSLLPHFCSLLRKSGGSAMERS